MTITTIAIVLAAECAFALVAFLFGRRIGHIEEREQQEQIAKELRLITQRALNARLQELLPDQTRMP